MAFSPKILHFCMKILRHKNFLAMTAKNLKGATAPHAFCQTDYDTIGCASDLCTIVRKLTDSEIFLLFSIILNWHQIVR